MTLQFGLLSGNCKDENDFVEKSIRLINEMEKYDEIDLDDLFFGNPPEMNEFKITLNKIFDNIVELKNIPPESRTYD